MKKVLATVAALGLVVGVTANALALDKPSRATEVESVTAPAVPKATAPGVALWSVSGQWVLAGAYLSQGMGAPGGAAVGGQGSNYYSDSNDAFYIYSFKILPVLQINDKVSVKGELRFADRDVFGISNRVLQATDGSVGGRIIDAYTVYLEYVSPVGKTRFGRTPAGAWGTSRWNDSSRQGDRLMWWTDFMPENWGMLVFTEKFIETDAGGHGGERLPDALNTTDPFMAAQVSDGDRDMYYIDLSYKADFGKTVGALWIDRHAENATEQGGTSSPWTATNLWLNGKYAWDAIGFEWEADIGLGDGPNNTNQKTLGVMLDLSYATGDFNFGALYYYGSGDDNLSDDDTESFMANSKGMGRDFNPYQIMNGDYMNMLNADNPLSGNTINPALITEGPSGIGNVGAWSIGIYGAWKMSPKMNFTAELGYFQANEPRVGQDDDLGVEIGFGMGYKIYNNLNYNAHFSYLATGDFFKSDASGLSSTGTTEDVYLIAHALSMKF